MSAESKDILSSGFYCKNKEINYFADSLKYHGYRIFYFLKDFVSLIFLNGTSPLSN